MNDRHVLIAFCSTLVAIVILYVLGAYLASGGKAVEALGLSGAGTGLIGVLGTFRPQSRPMASLPPTGTPTGTPDDPTHTVVDNPPDAPVPVEGST